MIFTNKINKYKALLKLSHLLIKGMDLSEALALMDLYDDSIDFLKMIQCLNDGQSVFTTFQYLKLDRLFYELLEIFMANKGLANALEDVCHYMINQENQKKAIQKKCSYPFLLVFMMLGFSYIVTYYLIPEMKLLFQGMNVTFEANLYFHFLTLLPHIFVGLLMICFVFMIVIIYSVRNKWLAFIRKMMKFEPVASLLKLYYSLKFAFYLFKTCPYFDNFFDHLMFLKKQLENSDLQPVINELYKKIKEGLSFDQAIASHTFLSMSFKRYCRYIFKSHQSFTLLEDYCDLITHKIQNTLQKTLQLGIFMIYGMTAVYVIGIYSFMLLPLLEMTAIL